MSNNNEAGKGDRYRPVNRNKWNDGWDRIFGKQTEQSEDCSVSIGATGNNNDSDENKKDKL